jgi:hypothetical protein
VSDTLLDTARSWPESLPCGHQHIWIACVDGNWLMLDCSTCMPKAQARRRMLEFAAWLDETGALSDES